MRLLSTAAVLSLAFVATDAGAATLPPSNSIVTLAANTLIPLKRAMVAMCVSGDGAHRRYAFTTNPNRTCTVGDAFGTGYYYIPGSSGYTGSITHFPISTAEK